MTTTELNRDIKRLVKDFKAGKCYIPNSGGEHSPEFSKEFRRLYFSDPAFQFMSPKNALALTRINQSMRFIGLHQFGINYEL